MHQAVMCPLCSCCLSRVFWYTHINACQLNISASNRVINPHKILSPTTSSMEVEQFQELNDIIKDPAFCHPQSLPTV